MKRLALIVFTIYAVAIDTQTIPAKKPDWQEWSNPESEIKRPEPLVTNRQACGSDDCGKDSQ